MSKDNKIYLPLVAVKFLGEAGAKELERVREGYGGSVSTFENLMEQVEKRKVNARARRGIYALGGFEGIAGDERELGLKNYELGPPWEVQLEHLGYAIPSQRVLDGMDKYKKAGYSVGIVGKKEQRSSDYGPYVVYKMQPSGVFWSRDKDDIEEGTPVAVRIGKKGKLLELRRFKF